MNNTSSNPLTQTVTVRPSSTSPCMAASRLKSFSLGADRTMPWVKPLGNLYDTGSLRKLSAVIVTVVEPFVVGPTYSSKSAARGCSHSASSSTVTVAVAVAVGHSIPLIS